jgi:hypothetical protein
MTIERPRRQTGGGRVRLLEPLVDRILPAGDCRVVTDVELIEELSFPVYRRISTMIFLPGQGRQASSLEMVTIDPRDLEAARKCDAALRRESGGNCHPAARNFEGRGEQHQSPIQC